MNWAVLTNVIAAVACFGIAVTILGWPFAVFMGLLHQAAVHHGGNEEDDDGG